MFSTGHFIGEMAFITNQNSSATVIASNEIRLIEWSVFDINKLFLKNKNIEYSLLALLAKDMNDKLQKSYQGLVKDEVTGYHLR
jgi:CRP-like cAMP-binding protein